MEHRWGRRLSTSIPVRLRCLQARDSGCRCLGCIENVSTTGALIRTELGICPSAAIVIEALTPALGPAEHELPACVVRVDYGEIGVEWIDLASGAVSAVLTESMLASATNEDACQPALGRVRFCARAPATAA
jgi:hypothetical protein